MFCLVASDAASTFNHESKLLSKTCFLDFKAMNVYAITNNIINELNQILKFFTELDLEL